MASLQQTGSALLTATAPIETPTAVKISIVAVEYAGAIATSRGEIPSWRVAFHLVADHLVGSSLTIQTIGPTDVVEARRNALMMLRRYALEIFDAAQNFDA